MFRSLIIGVVTAGLLTAGTASASEIGQCCLVDGTCLEVPEADCNALGGAFDPSLTCADPCISEWCPGEGGSCLEANGTPGCDDVACCESVCSYDPYCCTYMWDSICAGEAANDPNCVQQTGACCFPDGECTLTDEQQCFEDGGDWYGLGSTCDDCPVLGACCDPAAGTCRDGLTEGDCLGEVVYEAQGLGIDIPDCTAGGITHVIHVADGGVIADLRVDLNIFHTYVGDLCVTVTAPSGEEVRIVDRIGLADPGPCDGSGCCGCGANNFAGIILDDDGTGGPIETRCMDNLSSPPDYVPNNPLSTFIGKEKQGDWTIRVIDNASLDTGVLEGWSLHIITAGSSGSDFEWFGDMTCDEVKAQGLCRAPRLSVDKKGSLLIFPKVEIRWNTVGGQYVLAQDTFLDITNDYPGSVFVMLQFINGDPPLEAVYVGDPGTLVEREHLGWNSVDCQIMLTQNEPAYWSALTGLPGGCQPFTVLDPGDPPGRPDLDGPAGSRVLRGYVLAWAVGIFAPEPVFEEIRWNHLKGDAVIVNYTNGTAWEYNTYAFRAVTAAHGTATDDTPGQLLLDGVEYDTCFDMLLLDFYASGSQALSSGRRIVSVDTDLTLFPVSADLRQETEGPVLSKANFDIWNMEEVLMSSMDRCITCWDQTLLSNYAPPNYFMLANLQTDKGKARINGIASPVVCGEESEDAALLGVAKKVLAFSGVTTGLSEAGMTLVGMGTESAQIDYDIIAPPDELVNGLDSGLAPSRSSRSRSKR